MSPFNNLRYNPATGAITYADSGRLAGTINKDGYRVIMICGVNYNASNIAWFKMKGVYPQQIVDHRNRIRDDNRWDNLRLATRSQNTANSCVRSDNKLGVKGVRYHEASGRYNAYITLDGKQRSLGYYPTIAEASAAFQRKHVEVYKEFSPYHKEDL